MFNVAIIGCGRIASTFDDDPKRSYISSHIGAYKYLRDTKVMAVCDIDEKTLEKCLKKWNIQRGYTDYKEMLNKEKIDIVSVCTPAKSHLCIIKESVRNKHIKAIFCEKPLADNKRNATDIVNLCKKNNVILQVDHQRRFDPLHGDLSGFIKNKKFGDIQQINVYYTAGIKNTGSHMFDLLRFFFGEVEWIEGIFSKNLSHKKDDPNIDGMLKLKNGAIATFQACDVKKYLIFELNCFMDKGRIILKNSGFLIDFFGVKDSRYFSGYKELIKIGSFFKVKYKRNFMVNGVRHLISCIRDKKDSISSGIEGVRNLELIEAAIISANSDGKRIPLY